MERLLEDAEALSGIEYDIDNLVDVYNAIHVIQNEMGITGTTAKEAAGTISGSAATMKAAWENLLVGIADDSQNFDQLIENLVTSVTVFGDNILPRISTALGGVVNLISGLAPVLIEAIPPMIEQVVPQLLSGAESILSALASSLPGIVASIADVIGGQSHYFIQAGLDLILSVADGLIQSIPSLAGAAAEVINALAMWFVEYADVLMDTGVTLVTTIADALVENLPTLIPIAVEAVLLIAETLTNPDNLMALLDAAIAIIGAIAEGLINSLPALLESAPVIIANLVTAISNGATKMVEAAAKLIGELAMGIVDNLPKIGEAAANIITTVVVAFANLDTKLKEVGNNIVLGVWNGISERVSWFREKVTGFFKGIVDGVKGALGIHSPSRVFAEIGGFMAEGLGVGWDKKYSFIKKQIEDGMAFDAKTVDVSVSGDEYTRSRGVSVIQNIYSEAKTAADLMQEAIYQQERAVYLGV